MTLDGWTADIRGDGQVKSGQTSEIKGDGHVKSMGWTGVIRVFLKVTLGG